jgi:hypothetical protein
MSREKYSGDDSGLLRWTSCMSREIGSEVLLYKSYRWHVQIIEKHV